MTFIFFRDKTFKSNSDFFSGTKRESKLTPFSSSETKKSIVSERKALDSNCRDNNDEFKVQSILLPPSMSIVKKICQTKFILLPPSMSIVQKK